MPRWVTKLFIGISAFNVIASLVLWSPSNGDRQPDSLSSALAAGVAACWLALMARHRKDAQLMLLSIPFMIIFFLAIFGFTSYLLSALVSVAFVYLFITDLHAEP